MTTFRKRLMTGVVTLALAAGALTVYAAAPDCGPMGHGPGAFGGHGRSPERMREYMEKRAAALHDKLKLNATQETAWKAYMARMQPGDMPQRPDRSELDKLPAPDRMDKMLGLMKEHEQKMADRAAATREFYKVLTPEQQKIFNDEFGRGHGPHRGGPR